MLVILLNFYWISGTLSAGTLVNNQILSRSLFGNELLDILYSITLFHPFWTGGVPTWFESQVIPIYFWLIPIFAFLGLLLNRKNKNVIFFGFVALLGIFLTKQVSVPFKDVYPWLFENFPGFNAFREASKFYFLTTLGFSVLIASFLEKLWAKDSKRITIDIFLKFILTASVLSLFLLNSFPLITSNIGGLFIERKSRQGYQTFREALKENSTYSRVLWVPRATRWNFSSEIHPWINSVDLLETDLSDLISIEPGRQFTTGQKIKMLLDLSFLDNILDRSTIKYVVVPLSDRANADNVFRFYGEDREFYINTLDSLEYLNKVDIGTEEIVVYENEDFRPHIYTTNEKETTKEVIPYDEVEYTSVNPTKYTVRLENISGPIYLNFSESYHPGWKVRIGGFNWWESITSDNYFFPDSIHSKNDAMLNSFYIDPNKVCKEFSCTQNEDGSYDMEMTIFFKPQAYMYLGGIISLTTLAGVLGYLGYKLVKYLKMKDKSKT